MRVYLVYEDAWRYTQFKLYYIGDSYLEAVKNFKVKLFNFIASSPESTKSLKCISVDVSKAQYELLSANTDQKAINLELRHIHKRKDVVELLIETGDNFRDLFATFACIKTNPTSEEDLEKRKLIAEYLNLVYGNACLF